MMQLETMEEIIFCLLAHLGLTMLGEREYEPALIRWRLPRQ